MRILLKAVIFDLTTLFRNKKAPQMRGFLVSMPEPEDLQS
jgi:hypothetical protein